MLGIRCQIGLNSCKNFKSKNCLFIKNQVFLWNLLRNFVSKPKLEHVGVLTGCLHESKNYEIGQTFLHKVFAYRGVILHHWKAFVYRNNTNSVSTAGKTNSTTFPEPTVEMYYQVLVDSRDNLNKHVICDLHYLKNPGRGYSPLDCIPGMDYVSHDDIIPYTSVETMPVEHDLYDEFIVRARNELVGTQKLNKWQELNHLWLQLSTVYIQTTNDIRVTVIPFFLGVKSLTKPPTYWWRYCIRIESLKQETVKLCERCWEIEVDQKIVEPMVCRPGVIGLYPVLTPDRPAFQYSSHVDLKTAHGQMRGMYVFEKENGERFLVPIPTFQLESKIDQT